MPDQTTCTCDCKLSSDEKSSYQAWISPSHQSESVSKPHRFSFKLDLRARLGSGTHRYFRDETRRPTRRRLNRSGRFWKRITSSDETRSKNSPKKLATPEGNSQLGPNCPICKGNVNSWYPHGGIRRHFWWPIHRESNTETVRRYKLSSRKFTTQNDLY